MAIVISEEENKINWKVIIGVVFAFGLLLAATYYLFFSPTPGIEAIVPPDLKKVSEISKIDLSADTIHKVEGDPVRLLLKARVFQPEVGFVGRPNPFQTF